MIDKNTRNCNVVKRVVNIIVSIIAIIISQSGETADSLAALRKCKEASIKTLAIVNVVASSIAREADYVLYTLAGPEISVATTKAYSTQLVAIDILALYIASIKKTLSDKEINEILTEIKTIPDKIQEILNKAQQELEFLAKNGGDVTGVPTGFIDLDRRTTGLHPNELIIIAGVTQPTIIVTKC